MHAVLTINKHSTVEVLADVEQMGGYTYVLGFQFFWPSSRKFIGNASNFHLNLNRVTAYLSVHVYTYCTYV
jgi:hypothetical protein